MFERIAAFFRYNPPACADGTQDHVFGHQDGWSGWWCARCDSYMPGEPSSSQLGGGDECDRVVEQSGVGGVAEETVLRDRGEVRDRHRSDDGRSVERDAHRRP